MNGSVRDLKTEQGSMTQAVVVGSVFFVLSVVFVFLHDSFSVRWIQALACVFLGLALASRVLGLVAGGFLMVPSRWISMGCLTQSIFLIAQTRQSGAVHIDALIYFIAFALGKMLLSNARELKQENSNVRWFHVPISFFVILSLLSMLCWHVLCYLLSDGEAPPLFPVLLCGAAFLFPWGLQMVEQNQQQLAFKVNFDKKLRTLYQDARAYRLGKQPSIVDWIYSAETRNDISQIQGSLAVLQKSQEQLLAVLQGAMSLHTCFFLWLDEETEVFHLQSHRTAEGVALLANIPAHAGVIGSLWKSPMDLQLILPSLPLLAYYDESTKPVDIGSFMGIPLTDQQGRTRGMLCGDRKIDALTKKPLPFSKDEQNFFHDALAQFASMLRSEQLFLRAERSRIVQNHLYAASEQLNQALTLEEVYSKTFSALKQICSFEAAVITLYRADENQHHIVASHTTLAEEKALWPDSVVGQHFSQNLGWVAMAVKAASALPRQGVAYQPHVPIFDEAIPCSKEIRAVLVLPLFRGKSTMGTLVLASRSQESFDTLQRQILGVISNHIAISLENAKRYQELEAMATTDGLTQLLNRRAWQDRFAEMLERAERLSHSLAILLTDVDFFKKVNDTHGHPTGDLVLKKVAHVVQQCIRKLDLAGRYGGEEFGIILENVDEQKAFQLAERIRQEVALLEFSGKEGPFHCTISIGMSVYPRNAKKMSDLVDCADQALYAAKHNGRNQTIQYTHLPGK